MAARRDAIAKLTFLGLRIWAADKANAVLFRFAVWRHVIMPLEACARELTMEQNTDEGG